MAYSKQTWIDDDESSPISAERLQHIEDGVEAAHNVNSPRLAVATIAVANKTAATNSHNPVDATSGNLTVTLPTGQSAGTVIVIEKSDSSVNTVTCSGSIRGVSSSTLTLALAKESIEFLADSAGSWWPIAGHKTLSSIDARIASGITGKVSKGELVFSVKDYGATGNGTTDDTAAIQAAINAATAAGARLYFPPGTYIISGRSGYYNAILTFASNTYLFGDAQSGAVIKVANGQTTAGDYTVFAPATQNLSTVNITFENLTVDGNAANNIVLGSTGGNIRAARSIMITVGSNVRIEGCEFRNIPGRNVIMLGNNTTTPISNVWILNNKFYNVGGAITGNEAQNDHSSIYSQCSGAEIAGNKFWNNSPVNPSSPSTRIVCALETHGSNTIVHDNFVQNYTTGGRSVAASLDAKHLTFRDNIFLDVTELGLDIWCLSPYVNQGTNFINNKIRLYGQYATEIAGIFQPFSTGATTSEVQDLVIENNLIYSDYTSTTAATTIGIYLVAIKRGDIVRNTIRNIQSAGILLGQPNQAALTIEDVAVDDNLITDCALNTATARPFAIQEVVSSGYTHSRIHYRRNRIGQTSTTGVMRGIRCQGPGTLIGATIDGDNTFHKIADLTNIVSTASTTNFIRYSVQPRIASGPTATNPTAGVWVAGQDMIIHTDATALDAVGKTVTGSGGATSGTWAATTAYTVGQWIKTSGGKVLECTIAGTSSGVEPTSTTLGALLVDGTVTWAYRASGAATFTPYGAPWGATRRTITANTSLVTTDWVVFVNGTSLTATLPNATTASKEIRIANIHASANATVASAGGTINGSTTFILEPGESAIFESTGTNWVVF